MNSDKPRFIHCTIALFISTLIASGCSSSDNSENVLQPADIEMASSDGTGGTTTASSNADSTDNSTDTTAYETGNDTTEEGLISAVASDANTDIGTGTGTDTDTDTDINTESNPITDTNADSSTTPNSPAVPDPLIQNSTQVEFNITVPAYVSNVLKVGLVWGDAQASANWVGDELWSATADFPTATEELLVVTFYDRNGDITLGSFEATFMTGTNASEFYQVSADQFDTERWDDDTDGKSNIFELTAGTDPLLDETALLDVRDKYSLYSVPSISRLLEEATPSTRPYFEYSLEEIDSGDLPWTTDIKSIDIDASGTGSFVDTFNWFGPSYSYGGGRTGTRTNTGSSIIWVGREYSFDGGDGVRFEKDFTFETTSIDAQTHSQTAVIDIENRGNHIPYIENITYTLTGKIVDDSPMCEPIFGTAVLHNIGSSIKATITKDESDTYWTVVEATSDDEFIESYLVETLDAQFYCDYADL